MLQRSKIKYIQRLAHKKFRDETLEFVVEGPKTVAELLREKPANLKGLYALSDWLDANPWIRSAVPAGSFTPVTPDELRDISGMETPNQVLAVASHLSPDYRLEDLQGFILALEDIRDPGNLGTIVRTADWFGVTDVVVSPSTADIHNPKVVQASMGSLFRVNVHETDLSEWLGRLKDVAILGATLDGRDLYGMPRLRSGVVVVGNEAHGLSDAVLDRCTARVTIPRVGRAESLNASVATGILLSHLLPGA